MAKTSFFNRLAKAFKPDTKKSFFTNTSWRNNPQEGMTDNMLRFLLDNPFSPTKGANFLKLDQPELLIRCYETNPVVNAVINIKADALSNMKYEVKDLSNDEIIPLKDYDKDGGKLKELLSSPNPIQNGIEWLKQYKINYEVFGNGYIYAAVPVGAETIFDYTMINVLNNLPSANTKPIPTGKWLEATTKEEIIKFYEFLGADGTRTNLDTNKVWHTNTSNIRLDINYFEGVSKLCALQAPISNIAAAFETRNVMLTQRGALGFLSGDKKDEGLGSVALDDWEIDKAQKAMNKYGTLEGQYNHIISPLPLKYQRIAMSPKELQVFEEVESSAIAVSNEFGVPEILAKYYIKGATFENQREAEKRLYESTIIPESKDFVIGLNDFLKTKELGIQLLGSFDHLAILQSDKKDEAETNQINSNVTLEAFKTGAIVYNDYLASIPLPNDSEIGELRIWDLTPEQLTAIGVGSTNVNTNTDETQQNQGEA
ncbi:MAG: phage portal protein [Colwellia sp.]|nr:phage portal protein [Colwellia sp.]